MKDTRSEFYQTHSKMTQLERHFIEQADFTLRLLRDPPTETDEENHIAADTILSNFVREPGFTEIAEAYENMGKRYA